MASFTLKLGSFDLSSYCRMNPEDGFDPMGDPFQPAFGDTPMGDGQPLLNIQANNKEFIVPLHLHAADKQTVNGLVRTLRETINSRPVILEWADVGATQSTFFDVEWGKFNVEYNFRRAGYNYISGTLHIYVRPYGHTGTTRLVGTFLQGGNQLGKAITIPVASIQGDLAPLLDVQVWRAVSTTGVPTLAEHCDSLTIVSKLPSPSYQAIFKVVAGDFTAVSTIITDSLAVGSQAIELKFTASSLGNPNFVLNNYSLGVITLAPLSAYAGRNRILAFISPQPNFQSYWVGANMTNVPKALSNFGLIGATVVATSVGTAYYTVDLGTFDVPTVANVPVPSSAQLTVHAALASGVPSGSNYKIRLSEIVVLPEDSTFMWDAQAYNFVINNPKVAHGDGVNGRVYSEMDSGGPTGYQGNTVIYTESGVRGDLRSLDLTDPKGGDLLVLNMSTIEQNENTYSSVANSLYAQVKVRERFTYAR